MTPEEKKQASHLVNVLANLADQEARLSSQRYSALVEAARTIQALQGRLAAYEADSTAKVPGPGQAPVTTEG